MNKRLKRSARKNSGEKVEKTSISLPPILFDFASSRVRRDGYSGLSGYLQDLVRQDLVRRDAHLNPQTALT